MRILIDTHILIWYLDGSGKLPSKFHDKLNDAQNRIVISVASLWELAIKISLRKIELNKTLSEIHSYLIERDFGLLNISFEHLKVLSILPHHHRDPFDRLLIAQAISEDLTFISADQHFKSYPVNVIW